MNILVTLLFAVVVFYLLNKIIDLCLDKKESQ